MKRDTRCIISSMGYRLFHRRMRKLLSIADILIGGAVRVLLSSKKANETRRAPKTRNPPPLTSEWDYRPRETNRRFADDQGAGTETVGLITPSVAEDKSDNVSFDDRWLEFGTDSFLNLGDVGTTAEDEAIKGSLSDRESAVSAYDQSPIDERRHSAHDGNDRRPLTLKTQEIVT